MKRLVALCALMLLTPVSLAQVLAERNTLLDHITGRWIMTGTIDGQEVLHDVAAEWVLAGHYLYVHDLSRELDENGSPAYEARVYIGWDEQAERLVCLWLDVTGGGGLVPDGFGYGVPEGDRIPFVWGGGTSSGINNTFTYRRESDSWAWQIENVRDGAVSQFAQVVLTRDASVLASDGNRAQAEQGILDAIARLSAATTPGGGGADAYSMVLADDFSRRTLSNEQVQDRQTFIDGIRQWMDQGWRVASRESQMIDSTFLVDQAYTLRIVTEAYTGPDGTRSGPSTFALEETWQRSGARWLLQRATVYPVSH